MTEEIYLNPNHSVTRLDSNELNESAKENIEIIKNISNIIIEARKNEAQKQESSGLNHPFSRVTQYIVNRAISNRPNSEDVLKHQEGLEGGKVFGDRLKDAKGKAIEKIRLFFCEDSNNWFYYNEVQNGKEVIKNVLHYELQPDGSVLKIVSHSDIDNEVINEQEVETFTDAVKSYHRIVMSNVYGQIPQEFDQKLSQVKQDDRKSA